MPYPGFSFDAGVRHLQMLGVRLTDEAGVDGTRDGLGLLPVETVYGADKRTETATVRFGGLEPPFEGLAGVEAEGYEIRHGETVAVPAGTPVTVVQAGPVLGLTAHGVLASPAVLEALVGLRPARELEAVFDGLAELVEERLDVAALGRTAGLDL